MSLTPIGIRKTCRRELQTSQDNSMDYVLPIIKSMIHDQVEHTYADLPESYRVYRRPVVDWLIEVCEYCKLHITTTHAAISFLDRLRPRDKSTHEWQMIAITCIVIAAKYNESESDVPSLSIFERIINHSIPNEIMFRYELWALKRLNWALNVRSASAFLHGYYEAGIFFESDKSEYSVYDIHQVYRMESSRFATITIIDTRFKAIPTSEVAGCIVYHLRKKLRMMPVWRDELTAITHCDPRRRKAEPILHLLDTFPIDLSRISPVTPVSVSKESNMLSQSSMEMTDCETSLDDDLVSLASISKPTPKHRKISNESPEPTLTSHTSLSYVSSSTSSSHCMSKDLCLGDKNKENKYRRTSPESVANLLLESDYEDTIDEA